MRDMPLFNTAAGLGSFAWCESPDAHLKPALDGLCKERPESRQESHVSLSADLLGQVAEVCTRFDERSLDGLRHWETEAAVNFNRPEADTQVGCHCFRQSSAVVLEALERNVGNGKVAP